MTGASVAIGPIVRRASSGIPAPVQPSARVPSETDLLLEQTARGDRDAFASLYDDTSSLVYGIALRVVRDPARAEEITQEVFLEVWGRAARYWSERGSARAWIGTIAHRRAVDVVRSEEASRQRMERIGRLVDTEYDEVVEAVEAADDRRMVSGALGRLSVAQRQAVELAYFEGLTYREVSEQTGVPLGTIKTRMRAALLRLGELLENSNG